MTTEIKVRVSKTIADLPDDADQYTKPEPLTVEMVIEETCPKKKYGERLAELSGLLKEEVFAALGTESDQPEYEEGQGEGYEEEGQGEGYEEEPQGEGGYEEEPQGEGEGEGEYEEGYEEEAPGEEAQGEEGYEEDPEGGEDEFGDFFGDDPGEEE